MNDNLMVALFFESKLIDSIFYGDVVFENIFKGNELAKNKNKIIVSSGDIFGDAYQDITPYIFNNDFCTITFEKNNKYKSFKDWPYCWILEDIEPDIAKSLDVRLKKEFKAYFGMSLIDVSSCDKKKQFWKSLPRMFSINKNVITVFGISECGFGYYKTALENNLEVVFDEVEYDDDEEKLSDIRSSSIIFNKSELEEKKGKPSIDRGLEEMNFSLVKEVEISGIFIWKSIEDIDKVYIPTLKMPFLSGHLFLSLYEASQGIERLQKIIVELILYAKKYSEDEKKNANNLLKSHYHTGLNDWILRNKGEIKFSADANRLFNILEKFYNNVRYSRYSYSDDISQEVTLFLEFGKDCEKNDYNNRSLKRLYGKALGEISRKYYKLIEKISNELNIYVYEIPYEYPTSIVFLDYYDNNLYDALQKINVSKKELFYYLTQNHFSFNKENLLDKMKTINFDSSMINSYLEEIITNRNSSTELFSFVSEHYDEMVKNNKKSWKERIGIIDVLIANTSSFFLDDDENEDDNLAEEDYNFFDTNDEL